jgi:hypothetical protein
MLVSGTRVACYPDSRMRSAYPPLEKENRMSSIKDNVKDAGKKIAETAKDAAHFVADKAGQAADWVKEKTNDHACGATRSTSDIQPKMDVIASCGKNIGKVDHLEGATIKLTKNDSPDGLHHYIPTGWVARVDQHVHLSMNSEETMKGWTTQPTVAG